MDTSQKLGQKLIQGWTMLADSCSTCNCPLMRSRDGTRTICVACDDSKKSESISQSPIETISKSPDEPIKNSQVEPIKNSHVEPVEAPIKPASSIVEFSPLSPPYVPRKTVEQALLQSLDNALDGAKSTDVFIKILEAALKPIKSVAIKNTSFYCVRDQIESINQKIEAFLTKPCTSTIPQIAIAHFESIDKLLQISKEFDRLAK